MGYCIQYIVCYNNIGFCTYVYWVDTWEYISLMKELKFHLLTWYVFDIQQENYGGNRFIGKYCFE